MTDFQITDTREEILKILEERGAVLQKDLWKELNIDSSKCSRILRKLEKEGLIRRVEVVVDGVKTFKIIPAGAEEEVEEEEELDLKAVLSRMEEVARLPPCFACIETDCEAEKCLKLEVWFLGRCRMLS
ncbi:MULTISPECIES: helix-turn-helix transcriptional regulator [unclassified Archaeoglobus]|jgi:DNA-binding Lrp family transcriptional regulator|uniref:helix-turn-helix transcriptional regulator n=1 Tax=unclassified Archaeoglobus TaxID=2643606 RepID=UPI0025BB91EB|nr:MULTISPECIES: Lrp/AsnC family transcriptional regulator [unclassified Archaeoglobus]